MKTNIKLLVVLPFAAMTLAGCGNNTETKSVPPVTNAAPDASLPDAVTPPASGTGDTQAGSPAPVVPTNTNNPAVTNQ